MTETNRPEPFQRQKPAFTFTRKSIIGKKTKKQKQTVVINNPFTPALKCVSDDQIAVGTELDNIKVQVRMQPRRTIGEIMIQLAKLTQESTTLSVLKTKTMWAGKLSHATVPTQQGSSSYADVSH